MLMRIWLERIARWCVAGVLVGAGIGKAVDLRAVGRTIGDFGLVWSGWEDATAVGVIAAEIVAGGLLFFRRPMGYLSAAALLIVFAAVLAYGISIGLDIDCGCLGAVDRWAGVTLRTALARNVVLLVVLAAAWWWRPARKG